MTSSEIPIVLVAKRFAFEITELGATRVPFPLADSSKLKNIESSLESPYEKILPIFRKYADSIALIAEKLELDFQVGEDPVVTSVRFAEFILKNGLSEMEELDLSGLNLSILPPQMRLFTKLVNLNLSGNKLEELYPELASLETLENLDVSGNPLQELPDLSGLPHLAMIKARNCKFIKIPEWMDPARLPRHTEKRRRVSREGETPSGRLKLKSVDFKGNPIAIAPAWYDDENTENRIFKLDKQLKLPLRTQPE